MQGTYGFIYCYCLFCCKAQCSAEQQISQFYQNIQETVKAMEKLYETSLLISKQVKHITTLMPLESVMKAIVCVPPTLYLERKHRRLQNISSSSLGEVLNRWFRADTKVTIYKRKSHHPFLQQVVIQLLNDHCAQLFVHSWYWNVWTINNFLKPGTSL